MVSQLLINNLALGENVKYENTLHLMEIRVIQYISSFFLLAIFCIKQVNNVSVIIYILSIFKYGYKEANANKIVH